MNRMKGSRSGGDMRRRLIALAASCSLAGCVSITPTQDVDQSTSGTLFVANKFGNTLSRVDLTTGVEVQRVPACANPHELATSPDGRHVALACYGGRALEVFSTTDLAQVATIDLGDEARPHGIVWHANGDLYATAEGRRSIFWIRNPLSSDPETFEYSTRQEGSHMLTVSPDGNHAWTTDLGSKTVTLVDLKTRRAPQSVEIGIEPEGIALSPDGTVLWVSARGSDAAFELDPMTLEIRREVATGDFPLRLAIRPQGDVAVTSNLADGSLSVIDLATAKVTRTIAISDRATAQERFQVTILWSDDGSRIYVAETGTDTVAEVDYANGTVLRRLNVGDGGDGLAILGAR
ncbi:MAG: YncE family protein [Pontixanthobacter sp.]